MQLLQQQGFGQDWTPRQREVFQRQGGYAFHALWLWNIPDMDLRAWFRRQIQVDPSKGDWLWKSVQLLGLTSSSRTGKPLQTLPKSTLLTLLTRYPSPRDLYQAIQDRLGGRAPGAQTQPTHERPALPSPALSPTEKVPPPPPPEGTSASAIFAVASPGFVGPPSQPKDPGVSVRHSSRARPDPVYAYEPVHLACVTLLHAIEEMTRQYGREWLR